MKESRPSYMKDLKLTLKMINAESRKQRPDGNLIRSLVNKAETAVLYLERGEK